MSFWDPKKLEEDRLRQEEERRQRNRRESDERKRREDEKRLRDRRESERKLAKKKAYDKQIALKKKWDEEHPSEYESFGTDNASGTSPDSETSKPSYPRLNRGLGGPLNQPVSNFKTDPSKRIETPLNKVAEAQKADEKKEGSGDQQRTSNSLMRYIKW